MYASALQPTRQLNILQLSILFSVRTLWLISLECMIGMFYQLIDLSLRLMNDIRDLNMLGYDHHFLFDTYRT